MNVRNPSFEPYQGDEPYIFASYSRHDRGKVIDDLEQLDRLGFRIWYDAGIHIGADWKTILKDHLNACTQFIIFVSNNSVNSKGVHKELVQAEKLAKEKGDKQFIVQICMEQDFYKIKRPTEKDAMKNYNSFSRRHGIEKMIEKDGYFNKLESCLSSQTREPHVVLDSRGPGLVICQLWMTLKREH